MERQSQPTQGYIHSQVGGSLKRVLPAGQSVKTNTLQEEQGMSGELSKWEILRAITLSSVQAEAGIDCFPVDSQIAVINNTKESCWEDHS